MFYGLNKFFKNILPKKLFYRSLIIVAAPYSVPSRVTKSSKTTLNASFDSDCQGIVIRWDISGPVSASKYLARCNITALNELYPSILIPPKQESRLQDSEFTKPADNWRRTYYSRPVGSVFWKGRLPGLRSTARNSKTSSGQSNSARWKVNSNQQTDDPIQLWRPSADNSPGRRYIKC